MLQIALSASQLEVPASSHPPHPESEASHQALLPATSKPFPPSAALVCEKDGVRSTKTCGNNDTAADGNAATGWRRLVTSLTGMFGTRERHVLKHSDGGDDDEAVDAQAEALPPSSHPEGTAERQRLDNWRQKRQLRDAFAVIGLLAADRQQAALSETRRASKLERALLQSQASCARLRGVVAQQADELHRLTAELELSPVLQALAGLYPGHEICFQSNAGSGSHGSTFFIRMAPLHADSDGALDASADSETRVVKLARGAENRELLRHESRVLQALNAHPDTAGVVIRLDCPYTECRPAGGSEVVSFIMMEAGKCDLCTAATDMQAAGHHGGLVWLAEQAARAAGALRKAGVIHGDLKPANMVLTGAQDVKLIDFGGALITSDAVQMRSMAVHGQVEQLPEWDYYSLRTLTEVYEQPRKLRPRRSLITHTFDMWAAMVSMLELLHVPGGLVLSADGNLRSYKAQLAATVVEHRLPGIVATELVRAGWPLALARRATSVVTATAHQGWHIYAAG